MTTTETTTTNRERYVEKVRKLLAKAEGASTEAEAEAFFGKAADLIAQWEIEDAELVDAGQHEEVTTVTLLFPSTTLKGDQYACNQVALQFGLRVGAIQYRPGYKGGVLLIGRASDLERFQLTWSSIQLQMVREMKRVERTEQYVQQLHDIRTWRSSFKIGYCERVATRLNSARESAGTGLVLVREDVDQVAATMIGPARGRGIKVDGHGMSTGGEAGSRADLAQRGRVKTGNRGALAR